MELSEYIRKACIPNVTVNRPFHAPETGALVFSSHHLHFASVRGGGSGESDVHCLCLLKLVDAVEQLSVRSLRLRMKHYEWLEIEFPNNEDCGNAAYTINKLSRIDSIELSYPLFYKANFNHTENGWSLFATELEFSSLTKGDQSWRITDFNVTYSVCATYPRFCIVPSAVPERVIFGSAQFRAGNRFPVVAYVHERANTIDSRRFIPLVRASQPSVGTGGRRSADDEALLRAILNGAPIGYVIDTRSNAVLRNAAQRGGGCEIESFYPGWKPEFQALIDNPNSAIVITEALQRLVEAASDAQLTTSKYLSKLDTSGWPRLVRDALATSSRVASLLNDEGAPVIVHGSDGIDSTLLVSALAQLLLGKTTRTLRGFASLIDREFVQAGHPFFDRSKALTTNSTGGVSPIAYQASFLLFLDCVWQLTQQFPTVFEFNEQLLFYLGEHSIASQFGTFSANCEREREQLGLSERSVSIWSFILSPSAANKFTNVFFQSYDDVLRPCLASSSYSVWTEMYQRCVIDLREYHAAREHFSRLKLDYNALKTRYQEMCARSQQADQRVETNSVDSGDFEKI